MYYLKTATPDGSQYTSTTYPLLGEIVKTCPEVEAGYTHSALVLSVVDVCW